MERQQQQAPPNEEATEDSAKMEIQEDELEWAHEIRAAIKAAANLENVSDYECAQWAIISMHRQDLDDVLERVHQLQCFREQYKVHQSADVSFSEEGLEVIKGLMDFMPGYVLTLDYMPHMGHYLLVLDKAKFTPAAFHYETDWKHLIAGTYFLFQIMCSNLLAVREGIALINECMGMGFHNYSARVEERWMTDILYFFPFIHKDSMWLNSPTAANVLMSCLKPFLREEQYKQIHMGCKLDGFDGRIDRLFLQPTPEAARASLEKRLEIYLMERENNLKNYKLPDLPSPSADTSLAAELVQAPAETIAS